MSKKKIIALLTAVSMVGALFVGCGTATNKEGEGNKQETKQEEKKAEKIETKVTVGLSTDEGGRGDKSFNDSAIAGLDKIQGEYTVEPNILEAKKVDDYEPFLQTLAEDNELVFGVGFKMQKILEKVAEANPDTKFAIIDAVVEKPNVVSITFAEHEGSFLMGVIAGKTTKTNKVGFIGGVDMPLIQKFEAGFIAGVKSVNPEAAADLLSRKNVRYTGNFGDSKAGEEAAKQLYNGGIDVIYHAAGGCGIGLIKVAHDLRAQNEDVWAIGVDQDQALTLPDYADALLSSMMKRVDNGTYYVSKDLIEGNFKGGEVVSYSLADDGVGMAETTKDNTAPEVMELAEKYKKAIVDGTVKVPSTLEDLKVFEPVEVK